MTSYILLTICVIVVNKLTATPLPFESHPYTVVNKTDKFEVRRYKAVKVAHAGEKDIDLYDAKISTFMRLYEYMRGSNGKKQYLNFTYPFMDEVIFGNRCEEVDYYGKNYYIPAANQDEPPVPNDDKVEIRDIKEKIMYVRSFDYWTTRSQIRKNMKILKTDLTKENLPFDPTILFIAVKSPPWQVLKRVNEISFQLIDGWEKVVKRYNRHTKFTVIN